MSRMQTAFLAGSLLLLAQPPASAAPLHNVYKIPGLVDGAQPLAALVKVGGAYYGTTPAGGAGNNGTIFKIDAKTGAYTIVHNFAGSDGSTPSASLLLYSGLLFGTTRFGGQIDAGTIFSFDAKTGVLTTLVSFTAGTGDDAPVAPLVAYNGLLYGTSEFGGDAESGTIFSYNPATGTETTLYQFTGANGDGAFPQAALTVLGNVLFGTTFQGGSDDAGTIFSFDPASATEQALYSFDDNGEGAFPTAPLLAFHRQLYGTASTGGTDGDGDVFRFDPSRSRIHAVYSFTGGKDGAAPEAGLIALQGKLYGTTSSGRGGGGGVFEIDPGTGQETTLRDFDGLYDGATSVASLIADNRAVGFLASHRCPRHAIRRGIGRWRCRIRPGLCRAGGSERRRQGLFFRRWTGRIIPQRCPAQLQWPALRHHKEWWRSQCRHDLQNRSHNRRENHAVFLYRRQ
jgi:uncharacterized repeat protein (TIGR03803 family)